MSQFSKGCKSGMGGAVGGIGGVVKTFWHDSGTENQWLQRDNHHTENSGPSTESKREPWTFPFDGEITTLTFMNATNSSDTDIEIYKNGVLQYTWQIRLKKWATKTDITPIVFAAGDQLGVYAKKVDGGNKPNDVLIDVFIAFTSNIAQELGGATL